MLAGRCGFGCLRLRGGAGLVQFLNKKIMRGGSRVGDFTFWTDKNTNTITSVVVQFLSAMARKSEKFLELNGKILNSNPNNYLSYLY